MHRSWLANQHQHAHPISKSWILFLFAVKFIYSEKATKFLRNLHLFLTDTSNSQKKVEILQIFCGLLRIYELYIDLGFGKQTFLKICVMLVKMGKSQKQLTCSQILQKTNDIHICLILPYRSYLITT